MRVEKKHGREESAIKSDINVTPLVDVCLVLLIIFMVVTPLLCKSEVRLPETRNEAGFAHAGLATNRLKG